MSDLNAGRFCDSDPATESWRRSLEQSTGARLREALEANHQLALEHAKCVLEIRRLRAELGSALAALNRPEPGEDR